MNTFKIALLASLAIAPLSANAQTSHCLAQDEAARLGPDMLASYTQIKLADPGFCVSEMVAFAYLLSNDNGYRFSAEINTLAYCNTPGHKPIDNETASCDRARRYITKGDK
jgi:hypothetical protein